MKFFLDDLLIGRVDDGLADRIVQVFPQSRRELDGLCWRPNTNDAAQRSAQIQSAALALRELGVIRGWRDERYRCERPVADPCIEFGQELFTLERAAFRCFGLMSRAVHVHGLLDDGRVWCGRRAESKAIDPGRLDSLAAGGLPAGESIEDCVRRELFEEAGVPLSLTGRLDGVGAIRTQRAEPEGWHDEVLHVFNLNLPADFAPANQDGEVSEFVLLDAAQIEARIAEFTADAAVALRYAVLRPGL